MSSHGIVKSLRTRIVISAGLIALSSSLIVAPPALAKAHVNDINSSAISACDSDVAVIGVRGSGQDLENTYKKKYVRFLGFKWVPMPYGVGVPTLTVDSIEQHELFQGTPIQADDQTDHIEGFSNEVATAAFELRKQFPDSLRFSFVPVEYEAAGIETAVTDRSRYTASFLEGAGLVKDKIHEIAESCPNTQIAVIGFSQGSQAAHEGITRLSPSDRNRIASVVLISDPSREPRDTVPENYNEGSGVTPEAFSAGYGVFSEKSVVRTMLKPVIPMSANFPDDMKGKILSICAPEDKVCSTNVFMLSGGTVTSGLAVYGFIKHGTAYQNRNRSKLYEIPAKWSANLISQSLLKMDESEEQNTIKEFSKTVLCPDLNFISAGGQYDDAISGQPVDIVGGLRGDVPATMLWEIVKNAPKKTIGFKGVNYNASGSYGIESNKTDVDYDESLRLGIEHTNKVIDESLKDCKDTKLILFGNEQGSHVMHEVIAKLDKDKLSKIAAVWLISDPLRSGSDPIVKEHAGEPDTTMGGEASDLNKSGGTLKKLGEDRGVSMFPSELSGKVLSLCATSDGFCSPSPDGESTGYLGAYNMFAGLYEQPAKWVADKVK